MLLYNKLSSISMYICVYYRRIGMRISMLFNALLFVEIVLSFCAPLFLGGIEKKRNIAFKKLHTYYNQKLFAKQIKATLIPNFKPYPLIFRIKSNCNLVRIYLRFNVCCTVYNWMPGSWWQVGIHVPFITFFSSQL